MNYLAEAKNVFDIEIAALKKVRAQLDGSFTAAVEMIVETLRRRGKIIVVGIGKSGNIGQKIAATLTSTGSTSVVLNSVDALHGDVGVVNDGDLILALSYSGESDEMVNLMPALKRFAVKIICLTGATKSSVYDRPVDRRRRTVRSRDGDLGAARRVEHTSVGRRVGGEHDRTLSDVREILFDCRKALARWTAVCRRDGEAWPPRRACVLPRRRAAFRDSSSTV